MKAVTATMSRYPDDVVRSVTDPRSGLPSKSQFLPTIYEVRTACELAMKPRRDAEARRLREQGNASDAPRDIAPDERARVLIGLRELAAKMTVGV